MAVAAFLGEAAHGALQTGFPGHVFELAEEAVERLFQLRAAVELGGAAVQDGHGQGPFGGSGLGNH